LQIARILFVAECFSFEGNIPVAPDYAFCQIPDIEWDNKQLDLLTEVYTFMIKQDFIHFSMASGYDEWKQTDRSDLYRCEEVKKAYEPVGFYDHADWNKIPGQDQGMFLK
jgi:hypothetical protein